VEKFEKFAFYRVFLSLKPTQRNFSNSILLFLPKKSFHFVLNSIEKPLERDERKFQMKFYSETPFFLFPNYNNNIKYQTKNGIIQNR
jgi:hypothetical protein